MAKTEENSPRSDTALPRHLRLTQPSGWVVRWAGLIKAQGTVLDVAAGGGRHARLFLERGHTVTLIDRNTDALAGYSGQDRAEVIQADLENGSPWPLAERRFDCVVVTNYLYRPLFETLINSLSDGGVLIYETFARGNEAFTRPRNPDHLLKSGELIEQVSGQLQIVAYEHGIDETASCPGVISRICAIKDLGHSDREDLEPAAHNIAST